MAFLHSSFLLLLTQIIASEPSWYTEPNTRQAITFAVDSVEHGFKLTPKDAEASAGFEIRFNADLKSNGYFVAPETLAIRALNKQHKDTLSFTKLRSSKTAPTRWLHFCSS